MDCPIVTVDKGKVWWEKNQGRGFGSTYSFGGSQPISNEIPASVGVIDSHNASTIANNGGYDRIDPLLRWNAPFDGTITIAGAISSLRLAAPVSSRRSISATEPTSALRRRNCGRAR